MKRSKFNLSHRLLMIGDFGFLYPIVMEDLLPGDKVKCSSEVFCKAIPLLAPIMDQVDVRVDYFFVPNRLIWEKWQDFITGGREGTTDLIEPWVSYSPNGNNGDAQFTTTPFFNWVYQLGVKNRGQSAGRYGQGGIKLSALPAAAYTRIYYDWYMDQNVEGDFFTQLGQDYKYGMIYDHFVQPNGNLSSGPYQNFFMLRQRKYRKDMFTSALPWPQRGPEVGFQIPPENKDFYTFDNDEYRLDGGGSVGNAIFADDGDGNIVLANSSGNPSHHEHNIAIDKGYLGTLTINELRRLNALQKWFERNARWGSRYIEQILSHFGVRTPDYRLDRTEYLGGTVSPINVSETYQTGQGSPSQETADVLGQFAGQMSSYSVNGMRNYRAEEHGWLVGLMSIVPRPAYSQGIQRRFTRRSRLDYAWPEFVNLGEQAILNKELYIGEADGDFVANAQNKLNSPFGYTRRYAEYMSRQDRFDQNFLNHFPYWHLGRIFDDRPTLQKAFMDCRPDNGQDVNTMDRIFAYDPIQSQEVDDFHLLFQINNHIKMRRPLPKYAIPSL